MTSRPVDAAVVEAFLQCVSPLSLEIGLKVLEQLENDLTVQRRQRELQLEQARYEARLAQRQYDAVDPDNRLVASELERRWNEKLERVTRLEQAYNQAEQEAEWHITPEERKAIKSYRRTCLRFGNPRARRIRSGNSCCVWPSNPCNSMALPKLGRLKYRFAGVQEP